MRNENAYAGRTTVCRQCGALVGAGESSCSACGAQAGAGRADGEEDARRAAPPADPEALRFVRAVVSRPATFTFVFLIANIFLFLLVTLSGGSRDVGVLIAYGAKLNRLIDGGEWWRLVTPVFLHGSPFHLFVNMYGLFVLGPYVEKLYGSAKFVFFWVVCGVAGVAASYLALRPAWSTTPLGRFLFNDADVPSVGASGALFGLVGVLFVFGLKFRHELPEGFKRAFGTGMLPTIVINLVIGFTVPFIDNAAHLGGLAAGALFALLVGYKRPGERARVAYVWHALQALALAAVVVGFASAARQFQGPRPRVENLSAGLSHDPSALKSYAEAVNRSEEVFAVALKGETGEVETVVRALDAAPRFDDREAELRAELKTLLARAREFGSLTERERRAPPGVERRNQLDGEFAAWSERFEEWVKAGGGAYGLVHEDEPTPTPDAPAAEK